MNPSSDNQFLCDLESWDTLHHPSLLHPQPAVGEEQRSLLSQQMFTTEKKLDASEVKHEQGDVRSSQDDDDEDHPHSKRNRQKISDEDLRAKNERRLLQCRVSAKLSRERKKQFITTLEQQLVQLQQTKVELEAVVALLLCENERLRQARCGGAAVSQNAQAAATAAIGQNALPGLPSSILDKYNASYGNPLANQP